MISPTILSCLNSSLKTIQENEILELNSESEKFGLVLNQEDSEEIIKSRRHTLQSYGRIDLDINVTKQLIESLYTYQYTDKDDYIELAMLGKFVF